LSGFSLTKTIRIDGSLLEGGGSIVRNSVALATLFRKPLEIYNIRAKRSKPGLRNQHTFAVRTIGELCNAKTEGVKVGSNSIKFHPGEIRGGEFEIDVKTAGSLTLLLQAILPIAVHAPSEVKLLMKGGTDVPMAPPYDYLRSVFIPIMEDIGVDVVLCLGRRGHYPKGNGTLSCDVQPKLRLKPIQYKLEKSLEIGQIDGAAHAVQLPEHIVDRMISSASEELKKQKLKIGKIESLWCKPKYDTHAGPGTGITLWTKTNHQTHLAGDSLGRRGVPAEKVGKIAAENLIQQIKYGKPIDYHLADQLIIWMTISDYPSVIETGKITLHTLTNIEIAKQITNAEFEVEGSEGGPGIIYCEPNKS
jgi:RNA 3'-phosphate cyclase